MTTEQLRKIDIEIAEHVFGWKWKRSLSGTYRFLLDPRHYILSDADFDESDLSEPPITDSGHAEVPHYTTDPVAAKQVFRAIVDKGFTWTLKCLSPNSFKFELFKTSLVDGLPESIVASMYGSDEMIIASLCALKAVGHEYREG